VGADKTGGAEKQDSHGQFLETDASSTENSGKANLRSSPYAIIASWDRPSGDFEG
jgi:hypothetical protein